MEKKIANMVERINSKSITLSNKKSNKIVECIKEIQARNIKSTALGIVNAYAVCDTIIFLGNDAEVISNIFPSRLIEIDNTSFYAFTIKEYSKIYDIIDELSLRLHLILSF